MKKYFEIIRICSLFDNITDDNLFPMLGCLNANIWSFEKGETIIAEGEPAKNVGIVLSGNVQIVRIDFYGNRNIIANIEPSHLFGESFACADIQEIPVSVIASEKTEVMMIDCQRITKTCSNSCEFHNQIIFNLLRIMAMKNIFFNQKAEVTSKRTTREKLITYLMQQAKQHNSNSFSIPFDRQELADYLEVDRSGLSAEISKLRGEGIIECNRSKFKLL
ncbi:MAG: Crp/Fnr family transcriptional regulator [Ruminococcus sp.]|nr:Crp/Fnr family transcriptional regulator [Ruminococcus sp.]